MEVVRQVLSLGEARTVAWFLNPELHQYLDSVPMTKKSILPACVRSSLDQMRVDSVICIGGDGSILRVARTRPDLPILSVNRGRKGFMTEIDPNDVSSKIKEFLAGKFVLEEHTRIDAFLKAKYLGSCINECVITSTDLLKTIDFQLFVDEMLTSRSLADGIIISTPIGSTGHSLSSGGTLIDPVLENFEIVWINPLDLTVRPIVLSSKRKIKIISTTRINPIKLVFDGQDSVIFEETPIEIEFRPSSETVKFLRSSHFTSRWRRNFHPGLRDQS
ncbi:MAG: NAD(+)/NADH kinase [Candidatus Heimdallarchaeota archaeon]